MTTPLANPRVVVFAGPNGAGKSTHADAILAELRISTFVNADYIARGLAGQHAQTVAFAAGRIMLNRLRELSEARADFAFESTLSSRSFYPFLLRLKAQGYHVAVYYFALSSSGLAIRRVKHRVALGGHDVPAEVVKRRFGRSPCTTFSSSIPVWPTSGWCLIIPAVTQLRQWLIKPAVNPSLRTRQHGANCTHWPAADPQPPRTAKSIAAIGRTGTTIGASLRQNCACRKEQKSSEQTQQKMISNTGLTAGKSCRQNHYTDNSPDRGSCFPQRKFADCFVTITT